MVSTVREALQSRRLSLKRLRLLIPFLLYRARNLLRSTLGSRLARSQNVQCTLIRLESQIWTNTKYKLDFLSWPTLQTPQQNRTPSSNSRWFLLPTRKGKMKKNRKVGLQAQTEAHPSKQSPKSTTAESLSNPSKLSYKTKSTSYHWMTTTIWTKRWLSGTSKEALVVITKPRTRMK